MKKIIYTDGACKGNPGKGSWAFLILNNDNKEVCYENFGKEDGITTNQRMEMMAVIESLKFIKKEMSQNNIIEINTDSAYVANCFRQDWISNWIKKDWVNSKGDPVKNKDLWIEMKELLDAFDFKFNLVKGHSTNKYNNRVDELASSAT